MEMILFPLNKFIKCTIVCLQITYLSIDVLRDCISYRVGCKVYLLVGGLMKISVIYY